MQSSLPPPPKCIICGSPIAQRCKACSCSSYCSRDCQKVDWPVHKLLCNQFQKFSTPPQESCRRAILFPDDSNAPRFIWVVTEWCHYPDSESRCQYAHVKEHLGHGMPARTRARRNNLRSRDLQDEIMILSNDNYTIDGSSVNSSIAALTRGLPVHEWRGPILVMKVKGTGTQPGPYTDMDTIDLRDVVDLFCSYSATSKSYQSLGNTAYLFPTRADVNLVRGQQPSPPRTGEVPAVRINCCGDLTIDRSAKFEAIDIPNDHPATRAPVTSISKLIGLPIRVIKCTPNETIRGKSKSKDETNIDATFLQLNADPNARGSLGWGWAPAEWQGPAGSVLVVRRDCKVLLPQHLNALCYFCRYVMQPLFEDSMGSGLHPDRPMEKKEVLQRMTPRAFENFYIGYDSWKKDNDPTWDVSCPYPVLS